MLILVFPYYMCCIVLNCKHSLLVVVVVAAVVGRSRKSWHLVSWQGVQGLLEGGCTIRGLKVRSWLGFRVQVWLCCFHHWCCHGSRVVLLIFSEGWGVPRHSNILNGILQGSVLCSVLWREFGGSLQDSELQVKDLEPIVRHQALTILPTTGITLACMQSQ